MKLLQKGYCRKSLWGTI